MNYLVDANLPKYFSFFKSANFVHVVDINPSMTDAEIWNYALKNNSVILTKDTDFFSMSILAEKSPKIVYFQLGNQSLAELHFYFEKFWEEITKHLDNSFLIVAKPTSIMVIL
jgi:predicted nuclease of predicted toxin-antitoxin system